MIVATYRDTEMRPLAEELATLYREVSVERIALADGRSPHTPPPSAPTSTSARRRSSSADLRRHAELLLAMGKRDRAQRALSAAAEPARWLSFRET